jgi:5-oxoprolinase (ATP-hydrolysing)
VTDANVLVGKIQPAHFPAVFGPNGDQPLDMEAPRRAFAELAAEMGMADPRAVAEGFLEVAVAHGGGHQRVALERGEDVTGFALQCFGGAGGQHACRVAEVLGMRTVLIHPLAGVLSAYGMGLADRVAIRQRSVEQPLGTPLDAIMAALGDEAAAEVGAGHAASPPFTCAMPGPTPRCPSTGPGTTPCTPRSGAAHRARFGFVSECRTGRRKRDGRGDPARRAGDAAASPGARRSAAAAAFACRSGRTARSIRPRP